MSAQNFTNIDDLMKKKDLQGSPSIEAGPFISNNEFSEINEVVEHTPKKEVEQFVKPRHESISLPPDIKKLGAQSSSQTNFPSLQKIKIPISDDKAYSGLSAPIYSSIRWLATLAQYILACGHVALKKIHGKVVRVIKT